jgi:hypothetical protein
MPRISSGFMAKPPCPHESATEHSTRWACFRRRGSQKRACHLQIVLSVISGRHRLHLRRAAMATGRWRATMEREMRRKLGGSSVTERNRAMKNTSAFDTSTRFVITTMMPLLGRNVLLAIKALAGAFCGILTVGVFIHCWNALNWSELQTMLLLVDWNVFTSSTIIIGALAGVGCEVLVTLSRNPRTRTLEDLATIAFLQKLEHGDDDSNGGLKAT